MDLLFERRLCVVDNPIGTRPGEERGITRGRSGRWRSWEGYGHALYQEVQSLMVRMVNAIREGRTPYRLPAADR